LGPIAVGPSYQRKGIGKRLIDYGLKEAQEKGLPLLVGITIPNLGLSLPQNME
jgi:predicted N-acetyltransferase YhbS